MNFIHFFAIVIPNPNPGVLPTIPVSWAFQSGGRWEAEVVTVKGIHLQRSVPKSALHSLERQA